MLPPGGPPPSGGPPPFNRQRSDYAYGYPPQTHPAYYHPHQYYPQPHVPHHPQQWYPQQPYPPYPQQQQGPRPYPQYPPMLPPQQHVPMVVSSQPHMHHYGQPPPVNRPNVPTPSGGHPQMLMHAPPFTPSTAVAPQHSPVPSVRSEKIYTPPPPSSSTASRPSTAAEPVAFAAVDLESSTMDQTLSPFKYPLPWLSVPSASFPAALRKRRLKTQSVPSSAPCLILPPRTPEPSVEEMESVVEAGAATEEKPGSQTSTVAAPSDRETPATSQAPSEVDETPATPSSGSVAAPLGASQAITPTRPKAPAIPKAPIPGQRKAPVQSPLVQAKAQPETASSVTSTSASETARSSDTITPEESSEDTAAVPVPTPAPEPAPKSWADLVRTKAAAGAASQTSVNGLVPTPTAPDTKAGTLAEALRSYTVAPADKLAFLKPRGLVNTGNMCYMNSVLQTLAFSVPFYDFIDMVSKRATHSFKSETPLLDALILFLREYPVIDSASSVEQLRMRLKTDELEQFGEPFTPQNVYDVMRGLPRFASMKRGAQQDAEEFLIFLLETLHNECVKVINSMPTSSIETSEPVSPISERSSATDAGWQEVGPKQRATITQSSGHSFNSTPITKIFGGTQRSELRVPGKQNSVTYQPFQPLQLDIGDPAVHNIVDALKGSTRSETLHGDFNSPRGPGVNATKQMFIATLPPVLILHLKRFEFNNAGGTQKIWKKVGYPLELTIPKEVFPPQRRGQIALSGLPKYRLEGVIYHHGKNATSGHYTVDLRRQDLREWIRVDDTVIRRLRAEDVAEGGAEEDPKMLAKALEQHKNDSNSNNLFDQFGAVTEEDAQSDAGWTTAVKDSGPKKWSNIANGVATPSSAGAKTPRKEGVTDNKVAYILFYRQI